jgi:uncharacterized protein (TIGR02599 family)
MGPNQQRSGKAFTLVELLVSMTVLSLLMVVLVSITDATRKSWTSALAKTEQFREAREAFETITRRLSQATLNTYWDYSYPNNDTTKAPASYVRQSELRFISGTRSNLGLAGNYITHAMFFQAPLGNVSSSSYSQFHNLLNTCGFFIQYGSDQTIRPSFLSPSLVPYRNRSRLMELVEPSDSMTLYQEEAKNGGATSYKGQTWFTTPLNSTSNLAMVSENIIALVLLPKLSAADQTVGNYKDSSLAPNYLYDSTSTSSDANLNPKNQLPPVVQVTMVAIDEVSARRLGNGTSAPNFGLASLFQTSDNYQSDLGQLQANLLQATFTDNGKTYSPQVKLPGKMNFRVFTTNVSIKAAKWSRNQTN